MLTGWGPPEINFDLPARPELLPFLEKEFGVPIQPHLPRFSVDPASLSLPTCRLSATALKSLTDACGGSIPSTDTATRATHALGKSYRDLIRLRLRKIDHAPDAVVFPENQEQVAALLKVCSEQKIAVVPWGGGTSVVGGVEPLAGKHSAVVTLSLRKMNRLLHLDPVSRLATLQAGILGPELEQALQERGFTLSHFPQSFEFSTLGGWIAARSSGQNSIRYGAVERMVHSLKMVSPQGVVDSLALPKHACGPELRELLVGSEGTLGVLSEATVRVWPLPAVRDYRMLAFANFEEASKMARQFAQSSLRPAILRVSDPEETRLTFKAKRAHGGLIYSVVSRAVKGLMRLQGITAEKGMCMVLLGYEGTETEVEWGWEQAEALLEEYNYFDLGSSAGESWRKERFLLPYLRDDLMDRKLFAETLETSATWEKLPQLYKQVGDALRASTKARGLRGAVLCHISHVYPDGASLYFTLVAQEDPKDPLAQWTEMKRAANSAIQSVGGAASHHHGIGTDHRGFVPWSPTARSTLQNLKAALDPAEICNPEKLL